MVDTWYVVRIGQDQLFYINHHSADASVPSGTHTAEPSTCSGPACRLWTTPCQHSNIHKPKYLWGGTGGTRKNTTLPRTLTPVPDAGAHKMRGLAASCQRQNTCRLCALHLRSPRVFCWRLHKLRLPQLEVHVVGVRLRGCSPVLERQRRVQAAPGPGAAPALR